MNVSTNIDILTHIRLSHARALANDPASQLKRTQLMCATDRAPSILGAGDGEWVWVGNRFGVVWARMCVRWGLSCVCDHSGHVCYARHSCTNADPEPRRCHKEGESCTLSHCTLVRPLSIGRPIRRLPSHRLFCSILQHPRLVFCLASRVCVMSCALCFV